MASMKVKNSAGEWVNVANAENTTINVTNELAGIMKIAYIQRVDQVSYDLSEYVQPNDNFILFFVCGHTDTGSTSDPVSAFLHLDDIREVTNVTTKSTFYSLSDIHDVFEVSDDSELYTYTEDTAIFKYNRPTSDYSSVGDKAILFYTGIKEA